MISEKGYNMGPVISFVTLLQCHDDHILHIQGLGYCKTSTKHISAVQRAKPYIQLFVVVVQEDKLRVGPRNMLHHQVVAEKVTVKDLHKETMVKYFRREKHFKKRRKGSCERILKRNVLDHEGFDLRTADRINVFSVLALVLVALLRGIM